MNLSWITLKTEDLWILLNTGEKIRNVNSMLAVMAIKYLSAPPSSVPSESLFSDTGIIDSSRWRCLLAEKLEMLTFIK